VDLAGSVVAYCLKITNIDNVQPAFLSVFLIVCRYPILISILMMKKQCNGLCDPKIRIKTSGTIITYGKMATKSAIRDTARVLDLPI
jgi:DNA polymerase-3 subunit alpha